jgi:hypothetical protein
MVSMIFDQVNVIFPLLSGADSLLYVESSIVFVFVLMGSEGGSDLNEEISNNARQWHGGRKKQFFMIDNLFNKIILHKSEWHIPIDVIDYLTDKYAQLDELMKKCSSIDGSTADRRHRETLLKSMVKYCLSRVKFLVLGLYSEGFMTHEDIHDLGFLVPGEAGGDRKRKEPTKEIPLVKFKIVNEDAVTIIVDRSIVEDAAKVGISWPRGVKFALIIILASDGTTEIMRTITTTIYNDIRMPAGSHGKQFLVKCAFLVHANDKPLFGTEQIFSMPSTTQDLIISLEEKKQKNLEDPIRKIEQHLLEIEQHRLEIERLKAELEKEKEKNKNKTNE